MCQRCVLLNLEFFSKLFQFSICVRLERVCPEITRHMSQDFLHPLHFLVNILKAPADCFKNSELCCLDLPGTKSCSYICTHLLAPPASLQQLGSAAYFQFDAR